MTDARDVVYDGAPCPATEPSVIPAIVNPRPVAGRFAFVLAMFVCHGFADARPLQLDDIDRIAEVSEPRVSPDGSWIAYTLTTVDADEDEYASDLWMVRWDGSETVQLTRTPESETTPGWSPDGRHLAFLSDRADSDKGNQLWLLDMRGGEARQLSNLDHSITDYAWSPDGSRLALVAAVGSDTEDDEKPEPVVIDRYYFKEDVSGYLTTGRQQIFLLDAASGDAKQLTDGEYDHKQPSWSPDGKRLALTSKRGEDPDRHENWDIYVMSAEPGAELRTITSNPGADDATWGGSPPDWSPDGRRLAYEHGGDPADIWYGLQQVGTVGVDGADESLPTASLDRNTTMPRWSPDGRRILFLLEDDQSVQLARVDPGTGRVERLTPAGQVVSDFDLSPDGRFALVSGSPVQPNALWKLERDRMVKLSTHNDALLADVDLQPAETIRFDSEDGTEIHGMIVRPVTGRAPYPAVLRIHGGPVSQYQYEFDAEWQILAARGYLVIGVNPRGSSGRGEAFQKMLFADWGYADVPDVLAAVDHVVEAGEADPDRLGVGGWSYGGILTNYVIASTDRFRAATSGSGMSNMLGGYGIDQYVRAWEGELGRPWEATDTWLRLSYPFLEAHRISTPTLFLCGADDFNVPLAASEQMYQALRSLGVPTRLVIYPEQHHSLTRPSFRRHRLEQYLDWYGRHLEPAS